MKSKSVTIFWFSGTGNSLRVAQKAAEIFAAQGIETDLRRLEISDPLKIERDRLIGFVFPVYAFTAPAVVWRFIENMPQSNGTEVFAISTMGSFSGFLIGPMRGLLKRKGYNPIAAKEIVMPGNYLSIQPNSPKTDTVFEKGIATTVLFIKKIIDGSARWKRLSPIPYILLKSILLSFVCFGFSKLGRKIKLDTIKCNRCGLCVTLCPTRNIADRNGIEFSNKCTQCMRCITFCPQKALCAHNNNLGTYNSADASEILSKV
jgi:ferredoxin/flavodoxin